MTVEDSIYEAVKSAVWRGMLPEDFIKIVRQAWKDELQQKLRDDMQAFDKAGRGA